MQPVHLSPNEVHIIALPVLATLDAVTAVVAEVAPGPLPGPGPTALATSLPGPVAVLALLPLASLAEALAPPAPPPSAPGSSNQLCPHAVSATSTETRPKRALMTV